MTNSERSCAASGIVYTPKEVADEVTRVTLSNYLGVPRRILEPSVGEGAFLNSLISHEINESHVTAVDLDEAVIAGVRDRFEEVTTIHADFLDYALQQKKCSFDLVIGNPPFLKKTDFSVAFRERIDDVCATTGFSAGDMKNAWAVFVILSVELLDRQGVLAFIVPQQLLTTKYGRAVQRHLVKVGFEVDIFVADHKLFTSIEQHAVVIIARRSKSRANPLRILRVREFSKLAAIRTAIVDPKSNAATAIDARSILLKAKTVDLMRRLRTEWGRISDYCSSSTGTVTAANEVFIMRDERTERLKLKPWARRIVQKGSHVPPSLILNSEDVEYLSRLVPCNLIDFCSEGAPPLTDRARGYIEECESRDVHLRYKCQHRTPWYNIPQVPAGEGLFFKRSNLYPKLCINQASILATDTAYHVRMINGYAIEDLCFSFYNSITLLFAEVDGRSYFGGVLELTPKEFRGLPLYLLKPSVEELAAIECALESPNQSVKHICAPCDQRICKELNITGPDMHDIWEALVRLRLYRRRHSNGLSYEQWERSVAENI